MGGSDGGGAALHGGDAHHQLRYVGGHGEVLDILIQAALLVVHGDGVVVGGPCDAVPEGVPAVIAVVDADIVQKAQRLPHGKDVRGGHTGGAAAGQARHLIRVVQGQGFDLLSLAVHDLQRVAVVDVQGEGVAAGRRHFPVVHRQHDLIGVLEIVVIHLRKFQRIGAGQRVAGRRTGQRFLADLAGGVVLLHPPNGESGVLVGVIFQCPLDVQRAAVRHIDILRPLQDGGGRLRLHHDPGQGAQPHAVIPAHVGVWHGNPHRIGRFAAGGQTGQHLPWDHAAGFRFGNLVSFFGRFPRQLIFRCIVALEQLNGILEVLVLDKQICVGDPQHGGVFVLPRHDAGGPPRNVQGQVFSRHHGIGPGGAIHIIAFVGSAVVGGEGKGHGTHRLPRQHHCAGGNAVLAVADGGDVGVAAGPRAGLVGGQGLFVRAVDRGGQDGRGIVRQGEGIVLAFVADHHLAGLDQGRHRQGFFQAGVVGKINPVRIRLAALIGQKGDGKALARFRPGKEKCVCSKGLAVIDDIELLGCYLVAVGIRDHCLERQLLLLCAGVFVISCVFGLVISIF